MTAQLLVLLAGLPLAGKALPIPDGLADSRLGLAFVINAEQKVSAIDLARGKTRWTSADAAIPLGMAEGNLYVLKQDHIQALDPSTGKILLESQSLGLKGWSILGKHHSHGGQTFNHREVFQEGYLVLEWSAVSERVSGFRGVIREGEGAGKIKLDLKSGAVSELKAMPPPDSPSGKEPPFLEELRSSLPNTDSLASMKSLDQGHILVRRVPAHESVDWADAPKLSFMWELHDFATGRRMAKAKIPLLMRKVSVVGDSILGLWQHELPGSFCHRELRALDFRGRQKWVVKLWSPPSYPPVP